MLPCSFGIICFGYCGLQLLDVKFHIELLEDEEMIEA